MLGDSGQRIISITLDGSFIKSHLTQQTTFEAYQRSSDEGDRHKYPDEIKTHVRKMIAKHRAWMHAGDQVWKWQAERRGTTYGGFAIVRGKDVVRASIDWKQPSNERGLMPAQGGTT